MITAPARFPNGTELRAATEVRAAGRKLVGYAATWAGRAKIGSFTESILPTAFRDSLAGGGDILALVDHDPGKLLARTTSGTLRLNSDARGLAFEIDTPDTVLGNDILTMAKRGDLGGMSFAFDVPDGGDEWPAPDQRRLRSVNLREVSVVHSFPAYSQTSVSARARAIGQAWAAARIREMALATL